jgi:hypothetical protein
MHTIITLNQARLQLHIGKDRLRRLLEDCGIDPTVTGKQRKVINSDQLEHLRNIVEGQQPISRYIDNSEVNASGPAEKGLENSKTSSGPVEDRLASNDQERIRLAVLEAQVDSLSEQLTKTEIRLEKTETVLQEEKEDRRRKDAEVVEQTLNFQKMVQFLQQDNQALRQQLLEAPKQSKFDVDSSAADVEDSVDISTPAPAASGAQSMEYTPRSSSSWGLGIGLGAVAAAIIFYVLASDQGAKFFPHIQQKLVGALHLTDTGSIVPYSFDQDGTLR